MKEFWAQVADGKITSASFQEFLDGEKRPMTFQAGGVTYTIVSCLGNDEVTIEGHELVTRGRQREASVREEHGKHLLEHQDGIPQELRGKVRFVFPEWHQGSRLLTAAIISWSERDRRWVLTWGWLHHQWSGKHKLVHWEHDPHRGISFTAGGRKFEIVAQGDQGIKLRLRYGTLDQDGPIAVRAEYEDLEHLYAHEGEIPERVKKRVKFVSSCSGDANDDTASQIYWALGVCCREPLVVERGSRYIPRDCFIRSC